MPQMAPLMWLPLFVFFCLIFLMFTAFNYSIKTPNKISSMVAPSTALEMNWKW